MLKRHMDITNLIGLWIVAVPIETIAIWLMVNNDKYGVPYSFRLNAMWSRANNTTDVLS